MINNLVSEISSYLQHQDYSLAVRRLLDVCLDINKPELIQKAIDLSKIYHHTAKDKQEASAEFLNAANELIVQELCLFVFIQRCEHAPQHKSQ